MVPTPNRPTTRTLRTTWLCEIMHLLLGLSLRWLVFPKSIGRLPIRTRVPPSLTPWKFIPIGIILSVRSLLPSAVCSAHKQGALVSYPPGPLIRSAAEIPFEFPILAEVMARPRVLSSLRSIPLSFPKPRPTVSELPPHLSLRLGAMWTLLTCPPPWAQRQ